MFKQWPLHLRWKSEGGYVAVLLCPAQERGDLGTPKQIWRCLGMKMQVLPLDWRSPWSMWWQQTVCQETLMMLSHSHKWLCCFSTSLCSQPAFPKAAPGPHLWHAFQGLCKTNPSPSNIYLSFQMNKLMLPSHLPLNFLQHVGLLTILSRIKPL